jgi:hypothetical protein
MITKINKNVDTLDLVSEVHRAYKFLDKLPDKEGRHAVCVAICSSPTQRI